MDKSEWVTFIQSDVILDYGVSIGKA